MRIKKEVAWLGLLVLICLLPLFRADPVTTALEIPFHNDPPYFSQPIPNQTIAIYTNKTNAFTLENYFSDNESLTFGVSSANNITITIDEVTINSTLSYHSVSFYPDYAFSGLRYVFFNATDGNLTTSSNNVTINVTPDTTPPAWSNPGIFPTLIYQNNIVNFTTSWQDDFELKSYFLSISQSGTWTNKTERTFRGSQNTSRETVQISGGGGSTVYWKFYAKDMSDNINESAVQAFNVTVTPTFPSTSTGGGASPESGGGGVTPTSSGQLIKNISVDPKSVYLELKQGASRVQTLKITNTGNTDLNISLRRQGLEALATTLSKTELSLGSGYSETITLEVSADRRLPADMYFGRLIVSAANQDLEVPIVVLVKPLITKLEVNVEILEAYKEVKPGKPVVAEIKLENLEDIPENQNLTLYTALLDMNGETLDSREETFDFASRSLVLQRNFTTLQQASKGTYLFFARALQNDNLSLDADTFEIGERFRLGAFIKLNLFFIFIIIGIILILMFIIQYHRNKERLKLLNLYVMASELKQLIEQKKYDEAIELYKNIRRIYVKYLGQAELENKETLKKEMIALAESLTKPEAKVEVKEAPLKVEESPQELPKEENKTPPVETTQKRDELQPKVEEKVVISEVKEAPLKVEEKIEIKEKIPPVEPVKEDVKTEMKEKPKESKKTPVKKAKKEEKTKKVEKSKK